MKKFGIACLLCVVGLWAAAKEAPAPKPNKGRTAMVVDTCHPEKSGFVPSIRASLERAGFTVVDLVRTNTAKSVAEKLRHVDVIVFQGATFSGNRAPAGKEAMYAAAGRLRRTFHNCVFKEAVRRRKPLFGICLGMQQINSFFGGSIVGSSSAVKKKIEPPIAHRQKARGRDATHAVSIAPGSRLARVLNRTEWRVNSFHSFAAGKVSPKLRVTATAPDGVIEAVEGKSYPVFAVQFHPEMRSGCEEESQAIFNRLMDLVNPKF